MLGLILWSLVAGFLMGLDASVKSTAAWRRVLGR